jgi:hypothetical protein
VTVSAVVVVEGAVVVMEAGLQAAAETETAALRFNESLSGSRGQDSFVWLLYLNNTKLVAG